jgi:hypothetical protein
VRKKIKRIFGRDENPVESFWEVKKTSYHVTADHENDMNENRWEEKIQLG